MALTVEDKKAIVRQTWSQVEPIAMTAADLFYKRLFEIDTSAAQLFAHTDMKAQGQALMEMIGKAVGLLDDLDTLVPILKALGKRHVKYGIQNQHYDTVGQAFLWVLQQGLGDSWNDNVKESWTWAYTVIATTMKPPSRVEILKQSWAKVETISELAAELFYKRLFETDTSAAQLFAHTDMKVQGKALMEMIGKAVGLLDDLDTLVPILKALGKRHVKYGIQPQHYASVGQAFLWVLEQGLGPDFDQETREAWTWVYGVIAATMQSDDEKKDESLVIEEYKTTLKQNWAAIMEQQEKAAKIFYDKMMEIDQSIVQLFKGLDMGEQGRALIAMLDKTMKSLFDGEIQTMLGTLEALGRRHEKFYGVKKEHYSAASQAILFTVETVIGKEKFTKQVQEAWCWVFGLLTKTMTKDSSNNNQEEVKQSPASSTTTSTSTSTTIPSSITTSTTSVSNQKPTFPMKTRCIDIQDEGHNVKTFTFQIRGQLNITPGQYAMFILPIDGKPIRRSWTISSASNEPVNKFQISVKKLENGFASTWLHQSFSVDDTLELEGIDGNFSCFNSPSSNSEKYLFLTGGIGITPCLSMLRGINTSTSTSTSSKDSILLHSFRLENEQEQIPFMNELSEMETKRNNNNNSFKKIVFFTGSKTPTSTSTSTYKTGRMNQKEISELIPDIKERKVFLCGPLSFMKENMMVLKNLGVPTSSIQREFFDL